MELKDYLVGRKLIETDGSPNIQLVDVINNKEVPKGQFVADEEDKFFFAVKTGGFADEEFSGFIKFPNNFSTGNDPVLLKVSAVSVGDGGSKKEWEEGVFAKLPTLSISVNAVPDGVELNIPQELVVPGTEEMPIAMDIRGRLKDEAEEISEIKFTLSASSAAVPGAMIVSRTALQDYAEFKDKKSCVDLMRLRLPFLVLKRLRIMQLRMAQRNITQTLMVVFIMYPRRLLILLSTQM